LRSISTNENNVLIELGLNLKQSKIYLANLKTGKATVKGISKTSKVAREDVYRTLPSLENLGLITKHLGVPAYYEAIEPKEGFNILLTKLKNDYKKLNCEALLALENLTKNLKSHKLIDDSETTYISPKENLEVLIKNAKQAKETIDFTSNYGFFAYALTSQRFFGCAKELDRAAKRGVKVRTVINKPENAKSICDFVFSEFKPLLDNEFFEYRYNIDPITCTIIIFDSKKCLIEISDKQDLIFAPFLWSNNKILVELCKVYFDNFWKNAAIVKKFGNLAYQFQIK
jgi:sugar-specific transcriptional regulator TrmB